MGTSVWSWLIAIGFGFLMSVLSVVLPSKCEKPLAIGLLGVVIGGLVAIEFQLFDAVSSVGGMFRASVPNIHDPKWHDVVEQIAEYDKQSPKDQGQRVFEDILHEPLRSGVQRLINQAREGRIEISERDEAVLRAMRLMEAAKRTIRATSYVDPQQWWQSESGRKYAESQEANHAITTERIFIVDTDDELGMLRPVIEAQIKIGVRVKYLCASSLESAKRADFIVVDSEVSGELELDDTRHFRVARFFPVRTRAEDFENEFKKLWLKARSWSRTESGHCGSGMRSGLAPSKRLEPTTK